MKGIKQGDKGWLFKKKERNKRHQGKGRRKKDKAKRYRYQSWESSTKNINACF